MEILKLFKVKYNVRGNDQTYYCVFVAATDFKDVEMKFESYRLSPSKSREIEIKEITLEDKQIVV